MKFKKGQTVVVKGNVTGFRKKWIGKTGRVHDIYHHNYGRPYDIKFGPCLFGQFAGKELELAA